MGWPRVLNTIDIAVSSSHSTVLRLTDLFQYLEGLIECTPDFYLSELQERLFEAHKIGVNEGTIHRTLCR